MTVEFINLSNFLSDLRSAQSDIDRSARKGLEDAGKPILARASSYTAPMRYTGRLERSGTVRIVGDVAEMVFAPDHAAVMEWAGRGKYSSLTSKYGSPPRFGQKALESEEERALQALESAMESVVTIRGWADG